MTFATEFFAFSDGEDTINPAAGGTTRKPSSNDSASGEPFDVEAFGGGIEELDVGVDITVGTGEEKTYIASSMPGTSAGTMAAGRGSRGISIGIGVAAGAALANQHRGLKRELSESNIASGMAGHGKQGSIYGTMGNMSGRSMSEQQKLERRVSTDDIPPPLSHTGVCSI